MLHTISHTVHCLRDFTLHHSSMQWLTLTFPTSHFIEVYTLLVLHVSLNTLYDISKSTILLLAFVELQMILT
jgi:hypothetical protein